ncbi:MAG: hypothetical protein KC668_19540 [Myxococcales bacterium]|nr:hypothetical protein [Myxococcales bacterium]
MTPTPRVVRALFLSAALTVASTGCTSTETGNPPAQPETGLDAGRITLFTIPNMGDPFLLSGMADEALAAGGTLRVTAVETDLPAAVTPIGTSPATFSLALPAGFEGWLRLQVIRADGERLGPLDLLPSDIALGAVEPLPSPLRDCLSVVADLALEGASEAIVRLQSDCPETLSFEAPTTRLGLVDVTPAEPFELLPGRRVSLTVGVGALADGQEDVVLLFEAGGERRAVTITF